MIKEPEWKLNTTVTKKIQILEKDENKREIDAFDLEMTMPFILDVPEEISMEEVETNKKYSAKIRVYTSKLTPEIEELWSKTAKTTEAVHKGIEKLKQSGGYGTLYRFELVSLKPT
jgi:predicted phage-related endonuclease